MSRSGRICVRADATPEQCRTVAAALAAWYEQEFDRVRLAWIDGVALDELAEGRVPSPAWQRARVLGFEGAEAEARNLFGDDRAVGWAQSGSGDREAALDSLRRAVRGLAVERVELD